MALVKIPFYNEKAAERSAPLSRCIKRVADRTNRSEMHVVSVMTEFFEAVALAMCRGQTVVVPGFGAFGAVPFKISNAKGGIQIAIPKFAPARGLRNEVGLCCATHLICDNSLEKYRKRHHRGKYPERGHQRTFSALQAFRERVNLQVKGFEGDD